ncbi:MAG: sulfatase-like hydrolase/transferase [Bacilli bacterium]|nr:sulfatase-like hydrolase/transferase [Bacilli bacterium]
MKKNCKLYYFLLGISFFISVLSEKFIYNLEIFNFFRFIVIMISSFLFLIIISDVFFERYRVKLISFSSIVCDFIYGYVVKFLKNRYIFLIKISFSFIITLYLSFLTKDFYYFIFGFCEILIISLITSFIYNKIKLFGYVVNSFLLLLYNINIFVIIFGGTFLNMIMLTNISSISALRGKAFIYIAAVFLTLFFSFLPVNRLNVNAKNSHIYLPVLIIYEVILTCLIGFSYSVFENYCILINDGYYYYKTQYYIKHTKYDKKKFYNKKIDDSIKFNSFTDKKPNIIMIFTEGLSSNIIYDKRKIMPNLYNMSKESISFSNYYNHTAATYRGLIGQLYSGFQLNNNDKNYLISIEKILSDKGYYTSFINSEPGNKEFTLYLNSLQFDSIVSSEKQIDGYLSDKESYNFLYDLALEKEREEKPFFIGIYTFFTHVSFDSHDEVYNDGSDVLLNRFHNLDYQFGEFYKKFKDSSLYDNTIIIFTTDHASYVDADYLKSFEGYYDRKHIFYDKIPLFIYHKNIKSRKIDVHGRNSLDLAPTILDYIDESGPNYFLGNSLFSELGSKFDGVYYDGFGFIFDNVDDKYKKDIGLLENDINGYLSICIKK